MNKEELETNHGKLVTAREAAGYLGYSMRTLESWRYNNRGPTYIKMADGNSVRYGMGDLREFAKTSVTVVNPQRA